MQTPDYTYSSCPLPPTLFLFPGPNHLGHFPGYSTASPPNETARKPECHTSKGSPKHPRVFTSPSCRLQTPGGPCRQPLFNLFPSPPSSAFLSLLLRAETMMQPPECDWPGMQRRGRLRPHPHDIHPWSCWGDSPESQ